MIIRGVSVLKNTIYNSEYLNSQVNMWSFISIGIYQNILLCLSVVLVDISKFHFVL